MISTLEPPAPILPAVTQDRPGETTLVLRIRCHERPDMPAGNLIGTNLLCAVLKNELDAEGVHYSYCRGAGPLSVSLFMLSTSEPLRGLRSLKAVLEQQRLESIATIHSVNRETRSLVRLHPPPADSSPAATLDDLLTELQSVAKLQTFQMVNFLYPAGRVADYVDDAVTRAETAAAGKADNPEPDTQNPGDPPPEAP